jgi:hypothetical protein
MTVDIQAYRNYCHDRLTKVGCTSSEAWLLIRYAWNCPPKDVARLESLEGLVQAVERAPGIKEGLVAMAHQDPFTKKRIAELARLQQVELPKANKYYPDPNAHLEFVLEAKRTLRDIWPNVDEGRINGAMVVSMSAGLDEWGKECWKFSIENCDRIMRETESVDGW